MEEPPSASSAREAAVPLQPRRGVSQRLPQGPRTEPPPPPPDRARPGRARAPLLPGEPPPPTPTPEPLRPPARLHFIASPKAARPPFPRPPRRSGSPAPTLLPSRCSPTRLPHSPRAEKGDLAAAAEGLSRAAPPFPPRSAAALGGAAPPRPRHHRHRDGGGGARAPPLARGSRRTRRARGGRAAGPPLSAMPAAPPAARRPCPFCAHSPRPSGLPQARSCFSACKPGLIPRTAALAMIRECGRAPEEHGRGARLLLHNHLLTAAVLPTCAHSTGTCLVFLFYSQCLANCCCDAFLWLQVTEC